ncbi:MAG TPA: hypothetical protein VFG10_19065 [Saprospiraceae bacterium]|nr:hypothetical protein [Saprospiraceae bacterium]
MIRVFQTHTHDPENGIVGDCWRACFASILECDIDDFPSPQYSDMDETWPEYYELMVNILRNKGFEYFGLSIENLDEHDLDAEDTDGYVIAIGKSPRGEFNHAVVWKNGLAHDPHPDNTSIKTIVSFEYLKFNMHT